MVMLLACVTVSSTMSFSVHQHYCSNTLVGISLHELPHQMCCEQFLTSTTQQQFHQASHCCHDKHHIIQGQQELQDTAHGFSTHVMVFDLPVLPSDAVAIHVTQTATPDKQGSAGPPNRDRATAIYLLNETFLI